jgi:hypothetical protein
MLLLHSFGYAGFAPCDLDETLDYCCVFFAGGWIVVIRALMLLS